MASLIRLEYDGSKLPDSVFQDKMMHLLKNGQIPIQRGDLVQDSVQTSNGWVPGPNSRKLIWDGKQLLDLDTNTIRIAIIPRDFSCPFEFAFDHWKNMTNLEVVWLELGPIRKELLENHHGDRTSAVVVSPDGNFKLILEDIRDPRVKIASFPEILQNARVVPVLNESAFSKMGIPVHRLQSSGMDQLIVGMIGY